MIFAFSVMPRSALKVILIVMGFKVHFALISLKKQLAILKKNQKNHKNFFCSFFVRGALSGSVLSLRVQ